MAYQTGWIAIVDLELGSSVASKLDTAFSNIDTALDGLEQVENDTTANTVELQDHETRITVLETAQDMQYESSGITSPMTITSDTFQQVASVSIPALNNGRFEYKISSRFKYNNTSTSAVFRYAVIRNSDPSPTWYELWEEPKDVTDNLNIDVFFPKVESTGDEVELRLEARCEATGHQLDIEFGDVIIDQKR